METDNKFLTFIENHNKHFKKYEDLNSIDRSSITGWLYIFCAYCYDRDITKILPEFTDKFGKTLKELFERLNQYEDEVNITNIEAIQCRLSCERERLVKAYLKLRTPIRSVVGTEYFIKCRNLIKILMLIIVYISDEDIIKYEASYSNYKNGKNDSEYTELFDRIERYIDKIKENDEFELKIEENVHIQILDDNKESSICTFCNKQFSNIYNLKQHQKIAKYCIQLQNNLTENKDEQKGNEFECEFCSKNFTKKSILKAHYVSCKLKKHIEDKEELEKLELKHSLEIQKLENKHKEDIERLYKEIEDYKIRLIDKDNKLENLTKELLSRPSVVNNTTNTQQHITNYNNEYKKLTNELIPFSNQYIKSKIKEITPSNLIYANNLDNANSNIIDYNFACNIVNILKNNVFFTDIARGRLVYKDEKNNPKKDLAEKFILDCINISKEECLNICRVAIDTVREREDEFTDKDYGQCIMGLGQLVDCVNAGKPHAIITEIANKLCKNSKVLPSMKDFKHLIKSE